MVTWRCILYSVCAAFSDFFWEYTAHTLWNTTEDMGSENDEICFHTNAMHSNLKIKELNCIFCHMRQTWTLRKNCFFNISLEEKTSCPAWTSTNLFKIISTPVRSSENFRRKTKIIFHLSTTPNQLSLLTRPWKSTKTLFTHELYEWIRHVSHNLKLFHSFLILFHENTHSNIPHISNIEETLII